MASRQLKFSRIATICLATFLGVGVSLPANASVRIGTNASLPFQFAMDSSENAYVLSNMTALNGVAGLYVTKLNTKGQVVFSDRLGYNPSGNPYSFFLDASGNSYTVSSMTALNGSAGLYVTKINPSGAITYTTKLGTAPAAMPFSAALDTSGNVHVSSSMTSLTGLAGLYSTKLSPSGATLFSVRLGTTPATTPFQVLLDSSGNTYTMSNMKSLAGVAGVYLTKLTSVGTTTYSGRIGTSPAAQPFGSLLDGSGNLFTIGSMSALNGAAGLYSWKVNPSGVPTFDIRLGYNAAANPFWGNIDVAGNSYAISNMTSLSGVSGLYYTKLGPTGVTVYNGRLGYNSSTGPFGAFLDGSGNVYSAANMTNLSGVGGLYLNKINPNGVPTYNLRIGYSPASTPFGFQADTAGNVYAFSNMTSTGGVASFYVTKLNSSGGVVYFDRLGYNPAGAPFASLVDSGANAYTIANMTGPNNAVGLYFSKLSSTGNLSYYVRLGLNPVAAPFGYYLDTSGNLFSMSNMTSLSGLGGLYCNKLGPTGSVAYSVRLGSNPTSNDWAYFVDGSGNAFSVSSMTGLTGLPGLYVSKLAANGSVAY